MGFCYEGRKLVCDVCSAAGARKRKCPFGYCSSLAVCKTCWNGPKFAKGAWKASHKAHGCDVKHAAYVAKEAEKAAMLAEGKLLRVAALGKGDGTVHVIFRGKDGEVGYLMSKEAYDAFPLGAPVTPEDYATVGTLTPAPTSFYS
jgi:hypothetical protein